ncbi:hypothetical protein [Tautonia plasticadhaerens]|uniref:Uncharacterized protein n=1 Tax=Tautonia plasticadhaerens TaxID=2527974 RepID=A0A518HCL7_9BACT|nr:hypothetical protein [Tautonia plasticadhaerens]QDV38599.1 hypothetical protein ElP_65540 [Tautonia plasticadhaerens]
MDDPSRGGPPSPNRGRAARRHQRSRMIERARRCLKFTGIPDPDREAFALRNHDHLASCSCWMCGNPRRHLGEPTIQERRGDDARAPDLGADC